MTKPTTHQSKAKDAKSKGDKNKREGGNAKEGSKELGRHQ